MRTYGAIIAVVVLWGSITGAHAQRMLRVGPDRPFPTIQAAVNAANTIDTILVDPGTYPEFLTFPRPVAGLSIIGLKNDEGVQLWGVDTLNATDLSLVGLYFITTRVPSAVKVRSPGVRLLDIGCDVVGPCVRTPAPVGGVSIAQLIVGSQSAVEVNGTNWLLTDSRLADTSTAVANFVALRVLGSGHTIRNVSAYVQPATGSRAVTIRGHHITVEGSGFGGAALPMLIEYSNNITLQDTHLFSYNAGTLLTISQPGENLVMRRNVLLTIGAPLTSCGVRLPVGTPGVLVRGNLFIALKEAYCGGVSTSRIFGNLLRDLTSPDPGPADVVEETAGAD